ncbi:MAG: radical SAM protein [Thermodesulfobacteriota bacterium]
MTKLKINFVEPRANFNGFDRYTLPLLGSIYMGTILKERGHQVKVFSELFKPVFDEKSDSVHPSVLDADVIGISVMTPTALRGYALARAIRKARPGIKLVIGGVHPTVMADEALEFVDCVVRGEAEPLLPDLFDDLPSKEIVWGKRVEDINNLPIPDLTLLQFAKSPLKWAPIATARGCPHDCTFCLVPGIWGNKFRFREVDLVLEELQLRYQSGHRNFFFYDDYFTAKRSRVIDLLERIIKSPMKSLSWTAQTRADIANDKTILKLLKKSGCQALCLGLESVNPATLKAYQKKQTFEEMESCVTRIREHGIWVHGMFVLGADEDDLNTIDETVQFCKRLRMDSAQFSILMPIPGTKLFDKLDSQKRIFTKDWSLYDGLHVVFHTLKMSPLELQKNVLRAFTKFYGFTNAWGPLAYLYVRYLLSKWKRFNGDFIESLSSLESYYPHINLNLPWSKKD